MRSAYYFKTALGGGGDRAVKPKLKLDTFVIHNN